jgi:outer membrane protein TolC
VNTAQATAAQLENARLLFQRTRPGLLKLRGVDGDIALLEETVRSDQELLALTRNRYAGGIASDSDVAQAETQLYNAQAQLTDLGVQRAQLEHGIAVLIGKPPADPVHPARTCPHLLPNPCRLAVGAGTPPDIAEAERQASAANQQIGIAKAAFFPSLTFTAAAGV